MIRLATAHAKMRLGNDVTRVDAEAALDVMRFALGAEEVSARRAEHEAETQRAQQSKQAEATAAGARGGEGAAAAAPRATAPVDADEDIDMADAGAAGATPAVDEQGGWVEEGSGAPSQAATDGVYRALVDLLLRRDECTVDDVMARLTEARTPLPRDVVVAVLNRMSAENRVMFQEDNQAIYKI
jgi:hypothetical protein